jgi:hypothetical protein
MKIFNFLLLSACLFLAAADSSPAAEKPGTAVLIVSGGGSKEANHSRYENNVRIFTDVLNERGLDRARVKVLFHQGKDSEVRDPYSTNRRVEPEYGVESEFERVYRKNNISDIIDGPATKPEVAKLFTQTEAAVKSGAVGKVVLFTSDHGTPDTNNFARSYITLAGNDSLSYDEENKFVRSISARGAKTILIGDQCYSGHNMEIALKNPNACAFASAAPLESSWSLDAEVNNLGKAPPRLGYSTYSYFFSCALHRKGAGETLAEHDCDRSGADINQDGIVSLAEAHFWAQVKMNPESVPQISSQAYAQKIAGELKDRMAADEASNTCLPGEDTLTKLAQDIGRSIDPALAVALNHRLEMELTALAYLADTTGLRKKVRAKPDDSLQAVISKVEAEHRKFREAYDGVIKSQRDGLRARNEARLRREALREEVLQDLLKDDDDGSLANQVKAMKEAETKLLQPGVSPAARQIAQSSFNRAIQDISKQVDEELEKPDRELRMRPITDEITRLAEEKDRLEKLEAKILMNFGEVRRFQNAYEGYRAELAVVKHGSPAQKSKLVQLYECENETL